MYKLVHLTIFAPSILSKAPNLYEESGVFEIE